MAIPAGCTRVVFGGALPFGETWESGFWTNGDTPTTGAGATALAGLWYAQLSATDGSGGMKVTMTKFGGVGYTMTYVKVYCYPTGGPAASFIGMASGTPVTSATAPTFPNQIAAVISLRTPTAGRRFRGRMYLPCLNTSVAGGGQLPAADASAVLAAWALCFNDWNAAGDNGQVAVVSTKGGVATNVTQVQLSTRLDTQRGRMQQSTVVATETAAVT